MRPQRKGSNQMTAPSMHTTLMTIAHAWAERSTCSIRAKVGAVLVDHSYRVIASGYNGSPSGFPHCDDKGCHCDKDGHCIYAIHAEENAIIQCARTTVSCQGMIIYSTHLPCIKCSLRLIQAGIHKIIYEKEYGETGEIIHLLDMAGMKLWRFDNELLQPIL